VTSRDGTSIVYDTVGAGPVVILVGGGLDDGAENAPFAPELAGQFTVVNYSRRGRDGSGDTQPTLVTTGANAPRFYTEAADAIAACVLGAERRTVDMPGHVADPKILAPLLARFFTTA
jgi:hypothetical protein